MNRTACRRLLLPAALLAAAVAAVLAAPRAAGMIVVSKRSPEHWLGKLPNDSAAYFGARVDHLARGLAALPVAWNGDSARELASEVLGVPATDAAAVTRALSERLGIAVDRPISAAAMTVDEPAARKVMERLLAAARTKGAKRGGLLSKVLKTAKPALMHARIVVPLRTGATVETLVEGLRALTRGELAACKIAPACTGKATAKLAALGAEAYAPLPHGAVVFSRGLFAVVVDVVLDAFGTAGPDAAAARLTALDRLAADGAGGPRDALGACDALDEDAAASMCIDPARLAAFGTVQGWSLTVGAVAAVSAEYLAPILEAGFKEAETNLVLVRASGRSLVDFGATLRTTGDALGLTFRWTTTDAGRSALAPVVGTGLGTRTDAELSTKLFRPLRAKLPRATDAPFGDRAALGEAISMGGWPAMVLMLVQGWPEILASPAGEEWIEALTKPGGGKPPMPPWKWRLDGAMFIGEATIPRR